MKILVLERDIDVGLIVQEMLAIIGHEVTVVASQGNALTALSKERFEILFTDQIYTGTHVGSLRHQDCAGHQRSRRAQSMFVRVHFSSPVFNVIDDLIRS